MRVAFVGGTLGALVLMVGVQTAAAESNGVIQRTDPEAGSPAGVIYQIPLNSARRDAAPVLPVGSQSKDTGGGIPGSGGSSGSSGASGGASGGGSSHSASSDSAEGGGTPSNPSSIHSENGFGSSSQVPGLSSAELRTGAGVAAASTAGSTLPTYLLVALVVAAAIASGLLSARLTRRHTKGAAEPRQES
jgi:hypothetical protein